MMKDNSVSQEHLQRVKQIVDLSLRSLKQMYHEECLRFCYTIAKEAPNDRVPSFRYTAITLIGLCAAQELRVPVPFPLDEICADLAARSPAEVDLGNKALSLWAALNMRSSGAEMALESVLNHSGFVATCAEGLVRSTELAWTVYSLAKAWTDVTTSGGVLGRTALDHVKTRLEEGLRVLRSQRNGKTGLFACAGIPHGSGRFRDRMKTTTGFFDSQVYGAMALAEAGKTLEDGALLKEARETIGTILRLQGSGGEWPWHYDIRSGAIIDPYPIFSVHQDGMGPMMLLDVGESLKMDFQPAVERSLQWIFGDNELNVSLIDENMELIWRGIRRKGLSQYALQASRVLHYYEMPAVAQWVNSVPGVTIQYECRPYHLGWALYAFCRRSQFSDFRPANTVAEGLHVSDGA
jgi:hypothetical protein